MDRRIVAINVVYAAFTGAMGVIIPLLLLQRGIDLAGIGLLLAAGPCFSWPPASSQPRTRTNAD